MVKASTGRRRGGQPGNLNALKHGFYSRYFRQQELRDLEELGEIDIQDEITLMRVVTRRLMEMTRGCKDPEQFMRTVNTLGMASVRLGSLLKTQKLLGEGKGGEIEEAIQQAVREVIDEFNLSI